MHTYSFLSHKHYKSVLLSITVEDNNNNDLDSWSSDEPNKKHLLIFEIKGNALV